ncbi:MAG: DUF362 domain-containing protein [Spirochaetales bacterium]|nr:DUF362 domain-containing protein [Spirochaetales bacterium]
MKQVVSICCKAGPYENAKLALESLDLSAIKGKSVLIKPNNGRAALPEQGINTHPQAVEAVIHVLKKAGALRIAVGESPIVGVDTMKAFERSGIVEIAERNQIELVDLNQGQPVKKNIPGFRILESTKICSAVMDFDIILSLPVAKTHMHTGVTLGIKNMKGCLYRHEKVRYHQLEYEKSRVFPEKTLDSAISDLAEILMPDLTVVDGYIGMEGLGPSGGEAIKSDFAVASWNPMGADIFAIKMMGLDHQKIPHLALIAQRQQIPFRFEDYDIVGPNAADYKLHITDYKEPPTSISMEYPNIMIYDCESCSACQSTVMLFLKRYYEDMMSFLLDDGKFHLAIGKNVTDSIKKGTILVGNCTKKFADLGIFVPGCPPVSTRIYESVTGREPEENEPECK